LLFSAFLDHKGGNDALFICDGAKMCKDDWHDENRVTDDVFNVRCPHCGGRKLTRYKCPEYEE
jgi:hypothetical protein